jgi:RDD family
MADATSISAACVHCGSPLRANTPFCTACGGVVTDRQIVTPATPAPTVVPQSDIASPPTGLVGVRRGVRCTAYALDLAAMTSPALPLAMTAAIFKLAAVAYVVTPVAFLAAWMWMSIWQGLTGMSFGKAMLGLRAIRLADQRPPSFSATVLRGVLFAGTAGLAALPVLSDSAPCDGWHDRLSGITLIDIGMGDNPLGPRQQTALRRQIDRSLKVVRSPIPLPTVQRSSVIGSPIAVGRT